MSASPDRLANLTRVEAQARARSVSDLRYEIRLDFEAAATSYRGRCLVSFQCQPTPDGLFCEFVGRSVEALELNGRPLGIDAHHGARICLPPDRLVNGSNALVVDYTCDYDVESVGLHHFKDPTDGCEYLYTDYEPHDANRVYPCFDQPDLKAIFHVRVGAPSTWEVVSNTLPTAKSVKGDRTLWQFAPTPRISTYLMNVTAGEYLVLTDPAAKIPSRILARRSLAPNVDADELFEITRQGFEFYQSYFDVPYPFQKYDQIFVPEFKSGAMENVGAVVITDNVLFRHRPTAEETFDRAVLILHEMAHMWFGNLVTMRWWDGLWLNESFATYMSFLAAASFTDYPALWPFFDARLRRWAIWQDELSTTHAIDMDVTETQGCFNNFDGITYGKGCCVLKQLAFRLGAETFRKGVSAYLKKYAWQNTSNLDFIAALQEASGVDLQTWQTVWLHSSGVNTLACELAVAGDRIDSLSLRQTPGNGDGRLKEHRVALGLFNKMDRGFDLVRTLQATITAEVTHITEARGLEVPAFVHPNLGFEAYAKTMLDARSLATIETGLPLFRDAGVRSGIVDILGTMLQDALLPADRYLAMVMPLLPDESSSQILDVLSRSILACLSRYLSGESRIAPADHLHAMATQQLARGDLTGPVQQLWFRYFVGSAFSDPALETLSGLLAGTTTLGRLTFDQEMRWELVARLSRRRPDPSFLEREEQLDTTDRGVRKTLAIRASLPDPVQKAASWNRLLTDKQTSLELLKSAFEGFHQTDQEAILAPYATAFLEELPRVARSRSMEFAMAFAEGLFPTFHSEPAFLDQLEATIVHPEIPAALRRILEEGRDDWARLQRIRALARSRQRA